MNAERPLEISYTDFIFHNVHDFVYYKTTFELKEPLAVANGYPSLEIVSTVEYDADSLNDCVFVDMQDMRYGKTYCIETALIKGFRQIAFDARAYNEMLETEAKAHE